MTPAHQMILLFMGSAALFSIIVVVDTLFNDGAVLKSLPIIGDRRRG